MRGTRKKDKLKLQAWKDKAKQRRLENDYLKRRIQELTSSRSAWKAKYFKLKSLTKQAEQVIQSQARPGAQKLRHHSYNLEQIQLCLGLRHQGGCSYRACIRILQILHQYLGMELLAPSPSSIRNWTIKLGYAKIRQKPPSQEDSWALIMDESIQLGGQKILVLLGVNLVTYQFDQALKMDHIQVLDIRLAKSWKGSAIQQVIESIRTRGFQLAYCCCDNGNNLRKALKLSEISHVQDCGHALGKLLEDKYKKADIFDRFSKRSALFKRQIVLSKFAQYAPPKQRSKGRFLNLWPLAKWAKKLLHLALSYEKQQSHNEAFEKIKWILDYSAFIKNLEAEQSLINRINGCLKNKGLSKDTKKECEVIIDSSEVAKDFKLKIKIYLANNIARLESEQALICSSDIIESIFGKFKNEVANNAQGGMTPACLSIANYGQKMTTDTVRYAMESVKMVDIEQWRNENLPLSMQQKRNRLFKNTG